jgi:hypothetical protein
MFPSYLTLMQYSSYFTRSVQLISNLQDFKNLQVFLIYFPQVSQVSAPYEGVLKMQHFISFFLKFNSNVQVKNVSTINTKYTSNKVF